MSKYTDGRGNALPYWDSLPAVLDDIDNRLEALENVTELEALRAEIDELRYDVERWNDQARAEFARIERAILILTDSPSTPFASASAARAALLADG